MKLRGKQPISAAKVNYTDSDIFGSRAKRRLAGKQTGSKWEQISRRDFMTIGGACVGCAAIAGLSPVVECLNRLGSLVGPEVAYASVGPLEDGYYAIYPFGTKAFQLGLASSQAETVGKTLTLRSSGDYPYLEFRLERVPVENSSNLYRIEPTSGWMKCLAAGMSKTTANGSTLNTQTRIPDDTTNYQRFYIGLKTCNDGGNGYVIVPEYYTGYALTWADYSTGSSPFFKIRDDGGTTGIFTKYQLWNIKQLYSIEHTAPSTTWGVADSMPFLGAEYAACKLTEESPTVVLGNFCEERTYKDCKDNNTAKRGYFFTGRGYMTIKNVGYDLDGDSMSIKLSMLAMKGWNGLSEYNAKPETDCYPAVAFLKSNFLTRWNPDAAGNTYIGFQLETWCAEARVKMEWLKTGTSKAANCKIAGTFADVDIAAKLPNAPRWSACEGVAIPLQSSCIYLWKGCLLEKDTELGGVHIKTGETTEYDTQGYNKTTMAHFTTEESYLIIEYSGVGCGTRFDFYYPNIIPGTPEKSATITSG